MADNKNINLPAQARVSSSLEKILLHSSTTLSNKAFNWRKLWTPYSQKGLTIVKNDQESIVNSNLPLNLKNAEVAQSVQAPQFASKFYEEMERKYFHTSKKENINTNNINVRQSNNEKVNLAVLAKSSEHLRNLLVGHDTDSDENEENLSNRGKEGDLVSYETESAKNAGNEGNQSERNIDENVILSTYQNVVKNMRSTRVNKLDVVREDTTYELKGNVEDFEQENEKNDVIQDSKILDLEPKMPDQVSEQSDNNVVIAESDRKNFDPKSAQKVENEASARLVAEKMSKYETEVSELKDILFKTFEYVSQLKSDISSTASKHGSSTTSALVQTSMNIKKTDQNIGSQSNNKRNSLDLVEEIKTDEDAQRNENEIEGVTFQPQDANSEMESTTTRRKKNTYNRKKLHKKLRETRTKLRNQKSRNKMQHQLLEQLKSDIEILKTEAKSITSRPQNASPLQKQNTGNSTGAQPLTTARYQTMVKDNGNYQKLRNEELEKQENTKKDEEIAYLEDLNEKLTKQLEDNMKTMEEMYNTHEAKMKELEVKDKEIDRKNQQITELKVFSKGFYKNIA